MMVRMLPGVALSLATLALTGCDKDQATATPAPEPAPAVAADDSGAEPEPGEPEAAAESAALPTTDAATEAALKQAIAGEHRSPEATARDPYRHPLQTLEFFGLCKDMTVVELWPGGGWYTDILAPVLAEEGQLVVTSYDPDGPEDFYGTRQAKAMLTKFENEDLYGKPQVQMVDPPEDIELGEAASADMVVTFRNSHGWVGGDYEDEVYGEVYRVLEPGGILGVVQHRAEADVDDVREHAETGYVPEQYLIDKIESLGFRLVEKSEINANPKDTKDHPKGVWTLPPSYRLGDKDRDKYQAIGESDRMTLRFVKPTS